MDANRFQGEILPMKNKLYRFAYSLLNDSEESMDAVQEVFIKLWNIRNKMETVSSPEAFAMTVTRNYCLDRIKARRTVSLEQTKSIMYTEADEVGPERRIEIRDAAGHIRMLMEELPEQQKAVLHLRDIEGYEFEEIEKMLDMTVNSIRVNLSRARKKLRELYLKRVDNGSEKDKIYTG